MFCTIRLARVGRVLSDKCRIRCAHFGRVVNTPQTIELRRGMAENGGNGQMDDGEIRHQKAMLRRQVEAKVNALSEEEIIRQSASITAKVLAMPEYQNAQSVSIYLSFEKEVRTDELVSDILRSGRKCYIPRFRAGVPEMEMVLLHGEADLAALPVNRWGIRQPADHERRRSVFEAGELDLVLMPGQAFTPDGRRLGRGKGFYDRFLTRCKQELPAPPITLALAFNEQMVTDLPTTSRDVQVTKVLLAGR